MHYLNKYAYFERNLEPVQLKTVHSKPPYIMMLVRNVDKTKTQKTLEKIKDVKNTEEFPSYPKETFHLAS